jgi:glycosyl transferase, family 25
MHFKKFVINLPSRTDRRREMTAQLARIGWDAEFIEAVRPTDDGGFPSIGALGCFESHIKTLRAGLGSHIVLMEDDLNFSDDFAERWPLAVDSLPADWHIFYPAHNIGSGLIPPETGIKDAHMMVFRGSIVGWVIDQLETIRSRPGGHALGGPMHVDGAYSTIRRQNPAIITYACSPPLGYQRPSRTDIGKQHWLDRFPLLSHVARKVRTSISS